MATRAQKIKVGIFFLGGIALMIAVFGAISIKGRKPTETYFIKFQGSVRGLGKESAVLYQGVPVGKVEDIRVTEENEIIVTAGIERERVKLREGTRATLNLSNFMGVMQIELSGGGANAPELKPYSFIPSEPSVLEDIVKSLPKILADIKNILPKIDRALGDDKANRLAELIQDVDQVVKSADGTLAQLAAFLRTARSSLLDTENEITQTMKNLREATIPAERAFKQIDENPSSVFWGKPKPDKPYVQ